MDSPFYTILGPVLVLYGIFLVLVIAGLWRTFTKAGQDGWKALIPIYNLFITADIAKVDRKYPTYVVVIYVLIFVLNLYVLRNTSQLLVSLVQLAANISILFFLFKILAGVSRNFGKSNGFTWGLLFLSFIFIPILGFGKAKYQNEAIFDDDNILDANL